MGTKHPRSALARAATLLAMGWLSASVIRCDYGEYPLEPTFCDRWCRMLSRSGCDQEPENCVRNCERSLGPADCAALHEDLLACYEATPPTEFVCSGQGFQEIARPEESVCLSERDALIDCAYPAVKTCLDLCRAFDAVYGADAGDDGGTDIDAGAGKICPSYDIPCDSMCWLVQGLPSEAEEPGGDDEPGPTLDAGADIADLADEIFVCAIDRADACREPDPDGGAGTSANWASVVSACAEELVARASGDTVSE